MAHLDKSFTSYETFLTGADQIWSVDLAALNDSEVSGTALVAMNTEDDGTRYLNVSISADSMTPGEAHPQHIHGTFNAAGMPTNATSPDISDDVDGDGFVEVLEGVVDYGDVLVPLDDGGAAAGSGHYHGSGSPIANAKGQISYIQSFDIDDPMNLVSPVTGTQYDAADLMPLDLREIVLHGQNVVAGAGAGTPGEVNGAQDGYVPILPVAAGEIEATDLDTALGILAEQRAAASDVVRLGAGDDVLDTGVGDDRVSGGAGDDRLSGGGDDDRLIGNRGDDRLHGDGGADKLIGNVGSDRLNGGAGNDLLVGNTGADTLLGGADWDRLWGGKNNDVLKAGSGDDTLTGGNGHDRLRGGEGADVFVFKDMHEGKDTILDFEVGIDVLSFGKDVMTDDFAFTQKGEDAVLDYGDSMLTLRHTDASDISVVDLI